MDAILSLFHGPGLYVAIFVLLILCGVGNPIPEDLVLMTAGYLVASDQLAQWPTLALCFVGVLLGDFILYALGAHYGQKLVEHPRIAKMAPPNRVAHIRKNFQRWGIWSIAFARFLPGLRAPTFLSAGVMHVRWQTFALFDSAGAIFSVPLFFALGILFSDSMDAIGRNIRQISHWMMIVGVIGVTCWICWIWFKNSRRVNVS